MVPGCGTRHYQTVPVKRVARSIRGTMGMRLGRAADGLHQTVDAWGLVLAGGDGMRLRSLTVGSEGVPVPKQFCSFRHGPPLLHDALNRARSVIARERLCVVVADQHRPWWEPLLRTLPSSNVIVQPANRGTGIGLLLPLLYICERAPDAKILVLPSDHIVADESALMCAVRKAFEALASQPRNVVLLGIEPSECDPELGYIVPSEHHGWPKKVVGFVEKPSMIDAKALIERGGLWNSFIVAAMLRPLLELFERRIPSILTQMRVAMTSGNGPSMIELYRTLPTVDFSRDIIQGQESRLSVLKVSACGWTDLGTPDRVAKALSRKVVRVGPSRVFCGAAKVDLSTQHALVQRLKAGERKAHAGAGTQVSSRVTHGRRRCRIHSGDHRGPQPLGRAS